MPSAISLVPGGPSIACCTAKAIEWNKAFKQINDTSGGAALGVHNETYKDK
nr:hypothetical protein ['Catharanthus roseus' aster yellows phytoplasma]